MSEQSKAKRPVVSLLTSELIERIIEEAKEVLERVGVWIRDEEGLQLLGNGGARIDREKQRAFIPKKLVDESLKTVPSSIKLYDRVGNLKANLEGNNVYFLPMAGAVKVWDSDTKQIRDAVTKDVIDFVRVTDALDNIAIQSSNYYPTDVPAEIAGCLHNFICLRYGTKPGWGGVVPTQETIQTLMELVVAIRGSEKALREKPLMMFSVSPSSPLTWGGTQNCYLLTYFAKRGVPVSIIPAPLLGATAPVTITGGVTQVLAECFSGMVMSQLSNPGAPLVLGGCLMTFDMHTATASMGAIESVMGNVAFAEVVQYLNIPSLVITGFSNAKRPDSQSGLETGIGLVLGALAGANLVYGAGGSGNAMNGSLEKLVIDNEICGMAYRLLQRVTPRGERLAEDLFTEGLFDGNHFLCSPSTMRWFKEEVSYPGRIISRESIEAWQEKGSTTAEQRAKEEVTRILATHEPEPLDPDIDKELLGIITKSAQRYGMDKLPLP